MPRAKVLFIGRLPERDLKAFADTAPEGFKMVCLAPSSPKEQQLKEISDADFLIWQNKSGVGEEHYRAARKLKLVQTTGMGFDSIPLDVLKELNIALANIGGANAITVAEHAVTLTLAVMRRLIPSNLAMKQGKWRRDLDEACHHEVFRKTVGIVGLGNIGRWSAHIFNGFGAQIIFYDSLKVRLSTAALIPARQVPLDELVSTADIVSLHVPLNEKSRGLIGRREIALMKPSAILINTSRGPVVDEAALIEALRNNRIAGAGIDVFEKEPTNLDNPLLQMENVVCTPHMGGSCEESFPRRLDQIWENFEAVLRGERPNTLINAD